VCGSGSASQTAPVPLSVYPTRRGSSRHGLAEDPRVADLTPEPFPNVDGCEVWALGGTLYASVFRYAGQRADSVSLTASPDRLRSEC